MSGPDLVDVPVGGRGDRVDAQPGVLGLERGQRVVGLHGLLERARRHAERVVELGHAVQGQLERDQVQRPSPRGSRATAPHGLVRVPAVRGHVDLPHAVVADELQADLRDLLAEERLAAGEVQGLQAAHRAREGHDLVQREVVRLVEALPVEAVLALHVADRVDEQDQEARLGPRPVVVEGEACVPRGAADDVHAAPYRVIARARRFGPGPGGNPAALRSPNWCGRRLSTEARGEATRPRVPGTGPRGPRAWS